MLALGAELTLAARSGYEAGTDEANGKVLRGFNEIQHRVYARIREIGNEREWTTESFIDMIIEYSVAFGIEGDVRWALNRSIKPFTETNKSYR